jgi:hypothetical protein
MFRPRPLEINGKIIAELALGGLDEFISMPPE